MDEYEIRITSDRTFNMLKKHEVFTNKGGRDYGAYKGPNHAKFKELIYAHMNEYVWKTSKTG